MKIKYLLIRKYFKISKVWSADQVYKTLSLQDPENDRDADG